MYANVLKLLTEPFFLHTGELINQSLISRYFDLDASKIQ